jgi:hypothetical protein
VPLNALLAFTLSVCLCLPTRELYPVPLNALPAFTLPVCPCHPTRVLYPVLQAICTQTPQAPCQFCLIRGDKDSEFITGSRAGTGSGLSISEHIDHDVDFLSTTLVLKMFILNIVKHRLNGTFCLLLFSCHSAHQS